MRLILICAAVCASFFGLYRFEATKAVKYKQAYEHAAEYIQTTKGLLNETANLPDDPDDVLDELCRIAGGGESCGDP